MNVALCGPVTIHPLARAMGIDTAGLPQGIGPTPIAPLTLELVKRGHRVTLYTLDFRITEERYFDWGAIRVFVGPSRQFGAARNFYHPEIAYLRRVIQADNPSFIHSHWTYEFTLGALSSRIPTMVTIHDLPWNVLRYFRDRSRAVRLLMAYAVAMRASFFTAVSKDAARHFSRYMRPGSRVYVIPNFASEAVLLKSNGAQRHPGSPLVFGCVLQGWTRRKNATAAMQAFALFRALYPTAKLLMIGADYHTGGPAHQWARTKNVETNVSFIGELSYESMLDEVAAKVNVTLVPSLDESFSMTALEGMVLGKPVIAGSKTPGVREVLNYGETGILTNVRSPKSICLAMQRLQENVALFESLSRAGIERANHYYTAATVVAKYEQAYDEFVSTLTPHSSTSLEGVL